MSDVSRYDRWLEFPEGAGSAPDPLSRRDFVSLVGASIALAGITGCVRKPDREILSYIDTPPEVVPGQALHYATSMTIDGYATGLVVESHEGRPTKVEGNPDHPASLGASGILEQASVLQLYDPHRARVPRAGRRTTSLDAVTAALGPSSLSRRVGTRGGGLRVLMEPTASPLITSLLSEVRTRYPDASIHFFAPLESASSLAAARSTLGASLVPQFDFSKADVIVALDADFLASGPFHLHHAADLAARRKQSPAARMYVAETAPSPTSTLADRRIALPPSGIARVATALFDAVAPIGDSSSLGNEPQLSEAERAWVNHVARALIANRGRSAVIAGPRQPASVHTIAYALNEALANVGHTTWYTPVPIVEAGDPSHDPTAFAASLEGVDTLLILDVNICYAAPADLDIARHLRVVPNSLYLGAYDDETARTTTWHVPASHYLESWGDARSYDGTIALVQPLIAPLYQSASVAEMLAALAGRRAPNVHDLLTRAWGQRHAGGDAATAWSDALRRGVVRGSASSPLTPRTHGTAVADARRAAAAPASDAIIEIAIVPGRAVYDGRFANNAWLQELPDPITKLTWDNAALVGPAFATAHNCRTGSVVSLAVGAQAVEVPVIVVPGHAANAISIAMGYGRDGAEATARGVGVNANLLRTTHAPFAVTIARLAVSGESHGLAITQSHWTTEGRAPTILGQSQPGGDARSATKRRRPLTLYEPQAPSSTGFGADQWAMTIDLDLCTGCSACVVACQAENNIPVVGKKGVLESREMHWMRIDRYVDGDESAPRFETQPMLCQHCEKAPCEYVCPVNATVHSDDGLNEMVYNRCVGTRFCSNNCPYKVRRFNWFDYNDELAETERMAKNPSVTVRERGVMEKCTFCVQRIRRAQIDSELAQEPHVKEVVTACQQACPTHAIVFGSLTNPDSEVARLSNDPRAFSALDQLGTVPRVRYLRRGAPDPAALEANRER